MVEAGGLEPPTIDVKGRCSKPSELHLIVWSGWEDLNLRLPASKAGTLTGLRHIQELVEVEGIEPSTSRLKT